MKFFDKFLDMMGLAEVEEEDAFNEESNPVDALPEWKNRRTKGHVVPFNANKESIKVVLLEPSTFDDCQMIADHLKSKRTVIINLENLEMGLARRIIDFVGGTTYAVSGTLQKIGSGIVIAVPNHVDITGDINNLSQPKEVFAWINSLNQGSETRRY